MIDKIKNLSEDELIHRSEFLLVNYIKFGVLMILLVMQVALAWQMRQTSSSVDKAMQKNAESVDTFLKDDADRAQHRIDEIELKIDKIRDYVLAREKQLGSKIDPETAAAEDDKSPE